MIELINGEALNTLTSRKTTEATISAVGQALNEEAQIMFRNSQRRVPVDFGDLRRSGTILPPRKVGNYWELEMGYGGAAKDYAMVQHERPDFKHKNGRTWKYLEIPVRERIPDLEKRLATRVRRIIGTIR